jgi:hypothetical protein
MISSRSPEEKVSTIVKRIDNLTEKGICYHCSIRFVAFDYEVDKGRIEAIYLNEKLEGGEE